MVPTATVFCPCSRLRDGRTHLRDDSLFVHPQHIPPVTGSLAMNKLALILLAACAATASAQSSRTDLARWKQQAKAVTIVRDDWGIPHVYGKTDADAVFGLV